MTFFLPWIYLGFSIIKVKGTKGAWLENCLLRLLGLSAATEGRPQVLNLVDVVTLG